jgi:hypothetical protein
MYHDHDHVRTRIRALLFTNYARPKAFCTIDVYVSSFRASESSDLDIFAKYIYIRYSKQIIIKCIKFALLL